MKLLKKATFVASALSLAILSACGGSGSSGGSSSPSTTPGQIGDGYIQGAYICHDTNNDMQCLDEAIYATSDSSGSFMLSNYDASQPLLAQIPVGAIDHGPFADGSTTPRTFTSPVVYYYPANTGVSPIFISPLTTMLQAQLEQMPGMSLDDADTYVQQQFGIPTSYSLLNNYLEDSSAEGVQAHFTSEITNAALASEGTNLGSTGDAVVSVLANGQDVANTADTQDSASYSTSNYTVPNSLGANARIASSPVADICADLATNKYFAFEEWDSLTSDKEHKRLFTQAAGSQTMLQFEEHDYNGTSFIVNADKSSTQAAYLNTRGGTNVNLQNLNSSTPHTQAYLQTVFPAKQISCNGSNATFDASGLQYKLYVAESDISGMLGQNLPQGSSVDPILNGLTFPAGSKMYKLLAFTLNTTYQVKNETNRFGFPSPTAQYLLRDAFGSPMLNTADLTTLGNTLNQIFVEEYYDSLNYTELQITATPNSSGIGSMDVTDIVNGTRILRTTLDYTVEIHNGTPLIFVKNYYDPGSHLFFGKVNNIDASNHVFGEVSPAGKGYYLTQDQSLMDGDIMDDIMLNDVARDAVLTYNALPTP